MRFRVTGTDRETGLETTIVIEAKSPAEAQAMAYRRDVVRAQVVSDGGMLRGRSRLLASALGITALVALALCYAWLQDSGALIGLGTLLSALVIVIGIITWALLAFALPIVVILIYRRLGEIRDLLREKHG